nr:hypothetical protein GCM10017611_68800 [Rhodococcus wratislaviensis]
MLCEQIRIFEAGNDLGNIGCVTAIEFSVSQLVYHQREPRSRTLPTDAAVCASQRRCTHGRIDGNVSEVFSNPLFLERRSRNRGFLLLTLASGTEARWSRSK